MKLYKPLIAGISLVLGGALYTWLAVQATGPSPILYFPLAKYLAPYQKYNATDGDSITNHYGEDYTGAEGEAIYAPFSGTVTAAENSISGQVCDSSEGVRMNGNYIRIQDDSGLYKVSLLHMQTGSVRFAVGEHVTAGDHVGNMSNTGYTRAQETTARGDLNGDSTIGGYVCGYGYGIHVHVQLYENDVTVDPNGYWIRDANGVPYKAETTTSSASTCDTPDATTAFYAGEIGSTSYVTNNTTDPNATWSGVLEGEVTMSGSNAMFTVRKPDGSDFSTSGTLYLKVGSYEAYASDRSDPISVTVGDTTKSFPVDDQTTHEWCTYSKDYYIRYAEETCSNSSYNNQVDCAAAGASWEPTGSYTVVGPLTIEAVPALGRVANTDADYDGLDDSTEASLGTDANNSDTDGDGLSDGFEVDEGLDPLAVDSDGDGSPDSEGYADSADSATASSSSTCTVPSSGDWNVTSDCTISGSETATSNVEVADDVTLTIDGAGTLNLDLSRYHLRIGNGSRVIIESGGKLD